MRAGRSVMMRERMNAAGAIMSGVSMLLRNLAQAEGKRHRLGGWKTWAEVMSGARHATITWKFGSVVFLARRVEMNVDKVGQPAGDDENDNNNNAQQQHSLHSSPDRQRRRTKMDLATVKAKVKAWEKGFRATHGREPTKVDIKQDAGDIGA